MTSKELAVEKPKNAHRGNPAASDVNVRKRTKAREFALQFLYMLDIRGDEILGDEDAFFAEQTDDAEIISFAGDLVRGVAEQRETIDAAIEESTQNWELCRIATVDRNILREAIYELLFRPDIPPKVSINEAIELGKKYSTSNSGGFVNGILDRIKRDHSL